MRVTVGTFREGTNVSRVRGWVNRFRPAEVGVERSVVPLGMAFALSAVGGGLNAVAFPGNGIWGLVFLGTPAMLVALIGRRIGAALLIGAAGGLVFWGVHVLWLTVYLGPLPWAGMVLLQTVFFALSAAVIALCYRASARRLLPQWVQLLIVPAIVASVWTARESVSSRWPYGGFSWGRLAFSQSESPFATLVAWVGIAGVSFVVVWLSALLVGCVTIIFRSRKRARRATAMWLSVPVGVTAMLLAVPMFPLVESGTARIGGVQGNSAAGLFGGTDPGRIFIDHAAPTATLRNAGLDLLVWPENSIDRPLGAPDVSADLDSIVSTVDAPLLAGVITAAGAKTFNTAILWEQGAGITAQYDKIHPVPFAEYLPDRTFWYPLAPALFDLIPRDLSLGTRPNVIETGRIRAGLAICYDIVDDALIRQMIAGGANIIISPSNNADFGRSDEGVQQLAISRLRAIETGRSLMTVSTVGVTQAIGSDGRVLATIPRFTPGTIVADLPLSDTLTPAVVWGQLLEQMIVGAGGIALAALLLAGRVRRPALPQM